MLGLSLGLTLAQSRPANTGQPVETPIRIVPVSATKAFVIAPHEWGAIAYELIYQNGGNMQTPGTSVGAPFGGWRWYGTHHLLTVESNPNTPIATPHQDIGSVDSAAQGNFGFARFAGHYHGGIVINSSKMPDLTTERYVSSFNFGYEATLTWEGGETATVSFDQSIEPDGNLAGSISYTSTQAFYNVLLSMVIGNNFTHFSDDGGETWQDGSATANYPVAAGPVILRQPSTGYEIEIGTDQTGVPTAGLTNEVTNNGQSRLKHYVRRSSQGQPLGTLAMSRTITFRKTAPDPVPAFEPIVINFTGQSGNLPTGWIRTSQNTATGTQTSILEGGLWKLAAGAAPVGNLRTAFPLPTLAKDGVTKYLVEIDYTSLTNQTTMHAMINKDGLGSNSSANNLAVDGGSDTYREILGGFGTGALTASFTFVVPAGTTAPHLLLDGPGASNRGVSISEIRIDQV